MGNGYQEWIRGWAPISRDIRGASGEVLLLLRATMGVQIDCRTRIIAYLLEQW